MMNIEMKYHSMENDGDQTKTSICEMQLLHYFIVNHR